MPDHLTTLSLVAGLVQPAQRPAAARALAAHLQARELIIFITDPGVQTLLPAPGFRQTLKPGRAWRAFLAECRARGFHSATLPGFDGAGPQPAAGQAGSDGSVAVLLGGHPAPSALAGLAALLPVLAAAFQGEQVALTAAAQARLARDNETQARALADALDSVRRDLQHSLREAQQAHARANFLAEVGALLANALDYRATLPRIADLAVPALADCCALYLLEDQAVRGVGLSCSDRAQPVPLESLPRAGLDDSCTLLAAVLRSRRPLLVSDYGDTAADECPATDAFSSIVRDLRLSEVLGVPIVSRDRLLGVLLLAVSRARRRFDQADRVLAEELARRVALGVDNALLYEQARRLNSELEQRVLARTAELSQANAALESEVAERKRFEAQLADFNAQLQELSARVEAAREEERTRIAREIHDIFGQELTGLRLEVGRLQRNAASLDTAGLLNLARSMAAMIDGSIQTVRRIATDLRPAVLDDFGLVHALEWQVKEFESQTDIAAEFDTTVAEVSLDAAAATSVFRIAQEALTNIARHACATHVVVRLSQAVGRVRLEISDDGRGLDGDPARAKSLGLLGMRERVRQLAGELHIDSQPGRGTTVAITIPHPDKLDGPSPDLPRPPAA